jgi:hypothetical protein
MRVLRDERFQLCVPAQEPEVKPAQFINLCAQLLNLRGEPRNLC